MSLWRGPRGVVVALAATAALSSVVVEARAQQTGSAPGDPAASAPATSQAGTIVPRTPDSADPHTVFQIGVGLLALPAAEVCPTLDSCEPGETSVAMDFRNLGRYDDFGFGAAITWAFGLGTDAARGDETGALGRDHSRSYFVVEGEFRYYLPTFRVWEWWVGGHIGGVVVNDSWSTLADREPYADTDFVGPKAMTLATEGFVIGAGVGGHWRFADDWIFGTRFRYSNWFLPGERKLTPLGDIASLAGRIDIFDFGLVGGVRLSL